MADKPNPTAQMGKDEDLIVIIDEGNTESKTIKKLIIITPTGEVKREYSIKRTSKGRYLLN